MGSVFGLLLAARGQRVQDGPAGNRGANGPAGSSLRVGLVSYLTGLHATPGCGNPARMAAGI
jgi:hypothetical protein